MPQVTPPARRIFADKLKLPISLIVLATIIFCGASIGQEFFRGMMVRRRQTGSDPFTSMLGLMLSKRRKYGGYIIHLGVAVLFLGFVGKAYEQQTDKTIETDRRSRAGRRTPATPQPEQHARGEGAGARRT